MTISATGIFDELFLPTLGLLFISSLAVVSLAHFKSNSLRSTLQTVEVTTFYMLAAISFLLQVKSSWFVDFLSQFQLVEQPILWQRTLGDFLLAHKLTLDTTENFWITSQLLFFTIALVMYIFLYHTSIQLQSLHVHGYITLAVTSSSAAAMALFIAQITNAKDRSQSLVNLGFHQTLAQLISTVTCCSIVVFLSDATLFQVKVAFIFLAVVIYLTPFQWYTTSKEIKDWPKSWFILFLVFVGTFMMFHHFYLTFSLLMEWMNLKTISLVAFGYPHQFSVTVDLICCIATLAVFMLFEFCIENLKFSFTMTLLALFMFPLIILMAFLVSPGALFIYFLAYKENTSPSDIKL